MSTSLVRQSLDILSFDEDIKQGKKKKVRKSKGILHLIPTNQRINTQKGKKEAKTLLNRSSRTTVEEAKRKLASKTDQTKNNIEKLLQLSGNHLDFETSDKLLNRALRNRSTPKVEEPAQPEQTVFTEADFKKFEDEYHIE